ncbi:hypothetical protein [Aureimonas leprariae]|uniref:hypothetical protein n=1 Tax=Plantimonas leprariae TaxID=2615207 RepID=UPI003CCE3D02
MDTSEVPDPAGIPTGLDIVGGDVVEVAPQHDTATNTTQVLFVILWPMVGVHCAWFPGGSSPCENGAVTEGVPPARTNPHSGFHWG